MSQGDDIENKSGAELEEALEDLEAKRELDRIENRVLTEKDINFKRVKPTDLKFNPRVNPSSEATKNSEAAILVQSNIIRKCINEYKNGTVETTRLSPDEAKGKECQSVSPPLVSWLGLQT